MKQLTLIILVLCLVIVSGCSLETHKNETNVSVTSGYNDTKQDEATTSQKETTNAEEIPATTERSDDTTIKQEVSTESNAHTTECTVENNDKEPTQSKKETTTEDSNTVTTSKIEKPKEENNFENSTEGSTSSPPSEPTVPKASAADEQVVAQKIVEYINMYRAEQGVSSASVLPGLTKYAEYRSRQLVSNFAHDTADERKAATNLKYGEYIEPSLYGMTGEPYFTANAREAIAKTEYGGTVDDVAKYIARIARNSSSHWSYVGGPRYTYIAVGVTYEGGIWYCDIAMSSVNTDN